MYHNSFGIAASVIVVHLPKLLFAKFVNITGGEAKILVWGGLSISLVLSLPSCESKELLTITTYFCVVFSTRAPGLATERLAKRLQKEREYGLKLTEEWKRNKMLVIPPKHNEI